MIKETERENKSNLKKILKNRPTRPLKRLLKIYSRIFPQVYKTPSKTAK
jgi:hypothetical protein